MPTAPLACGTWRDAGQPNTWRRHYARGLGPEGAFALDVERRWHVAALGCEGWNSDRRTHEPCATAAVEAARPTDASLSLVDLSRFGSLTGATYDRAGDRIASWSTSGGTIVVWDAATQRPAAPVMTHTQVIDDREQTSDPHPFSGLFEKLGIAATQTGAAPFPMTHKGDIFGARLDAARQRILTSGRDNAARLWPLSIQSERRCNTKVRTGPSSLPSSPIGTGVLTYGTDGTIRSWDAATGAPIGKTEHQGMAGAIFNHGARIWSWREDGLTEGWDAGTLRSAGSGIRSGDRLAGLAVDTEGNRLLAWNGDVATLWDAHRLEAIGSPMNHRGRAGVSFTSAGLATWSGDGMVRLWDYATQEAYATWQLIPLAGARMESKSEQLVTWSADGAMRTLRLRAIPNQSRGLRTLDVEVRAGTRLLPTGALEALSAEYWNEKRRQLQERNAANPRATPARD
jgi:WD40 repeat protein